MDAGGVEAAAPRIAPLPPPPRPYCLETDETQIPGTVHLVDLEQSAATQHADGTRDIILVPTPSKDPNDPLNWSAGRKRLHLVCIMV